MTVDSGLVLPEDSQACAFCDYLAGRRPFTIVARGTRVAILVTREQRGIAHLLVVPLKHRPTILDLADDELGAMMWSVREAARAIVAAESPPGISVWQNNGLAANQAIPHVHFHVAGTLPQGGTERGEVPEVSLRETNLIAQRLRRAAPLDLK